jgi:hypothetical protein
MDDACPTTGGKTVCRNAKTKIILICPPDRTGRYKKHLAKAGDNWKQPFTYLLLSKEISIDDMTLL